MEQFITIKDKEIPLKVKNYKSSKSIKAYYKGDVLCISKPIYIQSRDVNTFIKKYEESLYDEYIKIKSNKALGIRKWKRGEKILYKGENYKIVTTTNRENMIRIDILDDDKTFYIDTPAKMDEAFRKECIIKAIRKIFQNNTKYVIAKRLNYWSRKTGIEFNTYKVHDATTRYGSCIKSKKALNFSSRLIMFPPEVVDAVVVHELCHIKQANHSKAFYELVESYIPRYKEIDEWLKENGNILNI